VDQLINWSAEGRLPACEVNFNIFSASRMSAFGRSYLNWSAEGWLALQICCLFRQGL